MHNSGNKYLADFGMAKAVLHLQDEKTLSFTITQEDGEPVSITETVELCIQPIRPDLSLLCWKEKTGTVVVQVHDYEEQTIYSTWTDANGHVKQLKGTLTPYHSFTVEVTINASPEACWLTWNDPSAILAFNRTIDDWHTTQVTTDCRTGGRYYYRMASKDGAQGFDFGGVYGEVVPLSKMVLNGEDGRTTINTFTASGKATIVTETAEPDPNTPLELQQQFCQGLLNSFKEYMEQAMPARQME